MTPARPSAQEERWLAVAQRHPSLHDAAQRRAGGWKSPSLPGRVLMFVLGLLGASMILGSLLWIPARWLVAGIAMIAAGEWLIRSRRLVAGGIEEALIGGGLVVIAGQIVEWTAAPDDSLVLLVFSIALLVAGLRLGNALFTTLAALGASLAIAFAGGHDLWGDRGMSVAALTWCVGVTLAALVLGRRHWQRPSHDRMLSGLIVAMPLAAFGWALDEWSTPLTASALSRTGFGPVAPASIALAFALLLAAAGIRRREHAPLIGAMLQVGCLAYTLREVTGLPLHGRLILWGGVLLAAGFALDRSLRRPRDGVTSAPLGAKSAVDDLVQVAGAAHATPVEPATATPGFEGQGGGFAGGGATGRY